MNLTDSNSLKTVLLKYYPNENQSNPLIKNLDIYWTYWISNNKIAWYRIRFLWCWSFACVVPGVGKANHWKPHKRYLTTPFQPTVWATQPILYTFLLLNKSNTLLNSPWIPLKNLYLKQLNVIDFRIYFIRINCFFSRHKPISDICLILNF